MWSVIYEIQILFTSTLYLQWSYGVLCWEVFSLGRVPYPGLDPVGVVQFLDTGGRLLAPRGEACSEEMYVIAYWACLNWQHEWGLSLCFDLKLMTCILVEFVMHFSLYSYLLMMSCWSESPNDRPMFSDLISSINTLIEPLAGYLDFNGISDNFNNSMEDNDYI